MLHFYDGQIRRYITQTIRALSNFTVKYGDGTLHRIPVMYGDPDRQVASIIRQNSENAVNSTPRIAVYIGSLAMDRARLADATHIGKLNIRERAYDAQNNEYLNTQGKNYTVERLMPTPFTLTMKADIWAANTDQKLQILEQLLVLFNPSLELQTSDNYIDWTSLTVLDLKDITWSSRQVPQGAESNIDVATLNLETPIWLSPPVKVKHLGVITSVITSIFGAADSGWTGVDSYGNDLAGGGTTTMSDQLTRDVVTISDFGIQVYDKYIAVLGATENALPRAPSLEIAIRQGTPIAWDTVFASYPGQFVPGSSKLVLVQPGGGEIWGYVGIDLTDPTQLIISGDWINVNPNDDLPSPGDRSANGGRELGTFDAIIDPTKVYPGNGMTGETAGDRFLIIEDIPQNTDAWGNFTAYANDIIEYDGANWQVIFDAQEPDQDLYQTNIYNGKRIQYYWNNVSWTKSFEGEYKAGEWRLEL